MYYTCINIKKSYKNNKFKTSDPTWNGKFQLHRGSHSVSEMQDYFEFIIKKLETLTDNIPIRWHVSKLGNKLHVQLLLSYKLQVLS